MARTTVSRPIEFLPVDKLGRRIQAAIDELIAEGNLKREKRRRISRVLDRLRPGDKPPAYDGFCARACQAYTFLAKDERTRGLARHPDAMPRKYPDGSHYWLQTETGGVLDLNFGPKETPRKEWIDGYWPSHSGWSPGFQPARSDPTASPSQRLRGDRQARARVGRPELVIDAALAAAVLLGLVANAAFGWKWADPAAGLVIVYYTLREAASVLLPRATTR